MNQTTLHRNRKAITLFAGVSFYLVVFAIPLLLGGPNSQNITAGVPQIVFILNALLGMAGLIAAYGAWQGQKWGTWMVITFCAIISLSVLPGVLFAPNVMGRISSTTIVMAYIFVVIVLLRRPKPPIPES